jgi:hypothetical protein
LGALIGRWCLRCLALGALGTVWRPWRLRAAQDRPIKFGRGPGIGHVPHTGPISIAVRGCCDEPLAPFGPSVALRPTGEADRIGAPSGSNRAWRTHVPEGSRGGLGSPKWVHRPLISLEILAAIIREWAFGSIPRFRAAEASAFGHCFQDALPGFAGVTAALPGPLGHRVRPGTGVTTGRVM